AVDGATDVGVVCTVGESDPDDPDDPVDADEPDDPDDPTVGLSSVCATFWSNCLWRRSCACASRIPVPQSWYATKSRISTPSVISVRPMPLSTLASFTEDDCKARAPVGPCTRIGRRTRA